MASVQYRSDSGRPSSPSLFKKGQRKYLCDKRIYFSTGWSASRAGRKWLLEFNQPAASLGRRRGGPLRRGRRPRGGPPRSPPSQAAMTARVPMGGLPGKGRLACSLWIIHSRGETFSPCRDGAAPSCPGSRQGCSGIATSRPDFSENLIP